MVLEEWDKEWTEHGLWTSGHHIAELMAKLLKQSQVDAAALRAQLEEDGGDARTLRGYIREFKETPTMTASNREHWKSRAESAEAALTALRELVKPETDRKYIWVSELRARLALPPQAPERRTINTVGSTGAFGPPLDRIPPQAQEPETCADSAEAHALKWRRLFEASTLETR